ncbi:MAG: PAS domain-containing protein [Acidimicrobiia bacterium]
MAQHPIEIILLQQWASMMSVPIWITDAAGDLIYFNEPTAALIGLSFEEAGDLPAADLSERFVIRDLDGSPLPEYERPLVIALEKQTPAQRLIRMRSDDGTWKVVADTAIPVVGEGNRHLGAMVLLWATDEDHP